MRLLAVIDEYTRECLAIRGDRHIRSSDVIETLIDLMVAKGVLDHIRSDNGPEFTARVIRDWLGKLEARTLYIEPGSSWENGYVESFKRKDQGRATGPGDLPQIEGGTCTDKPTAASGHTARWATDRRHHRQSCLREPVPTLVGLT